MRIGVTIPMTVQADTGELPGWPEIRRFAQHAESLGFHSLWVFDHLYSGSDSTPAGPIHEAWSLEAALAAVTTRVELGQLVTCVSFRSPGVLAKVAATTDEISNGRLTLGLGAGWHDREYREFGFPTDHRGSRFAEAIDIILPLLAGETVTTDGRFHSVDGARLLPPPARRIPILIAGQGPRMRRMIAERADAWNTAWYRSPNERLAGNMAEMRSSLDEAGRDHGSLRWTVGMSPQPDDDPAVGDAIMSFADLNIDDLIVSVPSVSPEALDRLAKAAAPWL